MKNYELLELQLDNFSLHTDSQLMGKRLRMARLLTSVSKQDVFSTIGVTKSTLDAWESGRIEITKISAEKICTALGRLGVLCNSDWLLKGSEYPPRMMSDVEKAIFINNNTNEDRVHNNIGSSFITSDFFKRITDEKIKKELLFFANIYDNAIFHVVAKDCKSYNFMTNDYVCGILHNICELTGETIIAVLEDGSTTLCKLLTYNSEVCEILSIYNNNVINTKIKKAARIILHRIISGKR